MNYLIALLFISTSANADRVLLDQKIFIERLQENNWVQYEVTCFKGTAADKKKQCLLSKKISGAEIVSAPYEFKAIEVILKDFFAGVSPELANFQDAETSDRMKWEISQSKKVRGKGTVGNDHSTLRSDLNPQRELLRTRLRTIQQIFESYLLVNNSRK